MRLWRRIAKQLCRGYFHPPTIDQDTLSDKDVYKVMERLATALMPKYGVGCRRILCPSTSWFLACLQIPTISIGREKRLLALLDS